MVPTMPCPLCGAEVEYERVDHSQEPFVDVEGRPVSQPDLSGLNVLVRDEQIGLIDFQECQWGHFVPNIVQGGVRGLAADIDGDEVAAYLEAYRQERPLPEGFEAYCRLWKEAVRLDWIWWD